MRRSFLPIVIVSILAVGAELASAESINFNQLPAAVQRTANSELKNGPIKQVQPLEQNGKTIYQVTYQKPGGTSKVIYLDSNGGYVQSQAPTSPLPGTATASTTGQALQLNQLPQPVQRTIGTETKNGPVDQIHQMTQNGQQMYEITFKKPDGTDKVIYLNPDGSYVQNGSGTANGANAMAAGGRQELSAATPIAFNSLPSRVQQAIKREAGTAQVEAVQQGQLNGQTVYEAAFKQSGQTVKLRVTPTGSVVQDPVDQRIVMNGPLINAQPVGLNQIPPVIKNVVQSEAGPGAPVQSLKKGQLNGQTVYDAIVSRNGQPLGLRINENGTILSVSSAQGSTLLGR